MSRSLSEVGTTSVENLLQGLHQPGEQRPAPSQTSFLFPPRKVDKQGPLPPGKYLRRSLGAPNSSSSEVSPPASNAASPVNTGDTAVLRTEGPPKETPWKTLGGGGGKTKPWTPPEEELTLPPRRVPLGVNAVMISSASFLHSRGGYEAEAAVAKTPFTWPIS